MSRKNDRKHVLSLIFSLDFNTTQPQYEYYAEHFALDAVESEISEPDYIQEVFGGVEKHKEEIDSLIGKNAEGWNFERLSRIDKAIMRLAICEMLYIDSITTSIAINEAVELAKEYSTDEAPRFINGILGKIARNIGGIEV